MQNSTKFLLGIVIGIGLLVIITFAVVMLRPEPTYQDDTTRQRHAEIRAELAAKRDAQLS